MSILSASGVRIEDISDLVRNDAGDWFEPALPTAEPGGLERRVRAVRKGAVG